MCKTVWLSDEKGKKAKKKERKGKKEEKNRHARISQWLKFTSRGHESIRHVNGYDLSFSSINVHFR